MPRETRDRCHRRRASELTRGRLTGRLASWAALLLLLLLPVSGAVALVGVPSGERIGAAGSDIVGAAASVACPPVAGGSGFGAPTILEPAAGTRVRAGEPVRLLAQLPGEGPDVLVRFQVPETGQSVCAEVPFGTGEASVTITSPGKRTIVASMLTPWVGIDADPAGPTQELWYAGAPSPEVPIEVVPLVAVSLSPDGGSGPVGETVQWVATVTAGGTPLVERSVSFSALLPGGPPVFMTDETDGSGQAVFRHTRSGPGVDEITVSVSALGQDVSGSTTYTWVEPPAPLDVSLTTSGTSGSVGTTLAWTATVTSDGEPVGGASVRFLGQLAGGPDEDVTLTTDPSGQATHEHTRATTGTETLTVTAREDARTGVDSGSFTWLPAPSEPVLDIELSPADSTGPIGGTATWTATVTLDGEPARGVPVDFRGVLAGVDDIVGTDLTDDSGRATHSHSRATAGTETVTATATSGGQTATDDTGWTWVEPTVPPTTTDPPTTTGPPETSDPPGTTEPTDPPGPVDPSGADPEDEPTPIPPIDTSDPPPADAEPIGELVLGRESVIPGGDLEVSGEGCEPGSTVDISLAGELLASTVADADGTFTVRAPVSNEPLGQYVLRVRCGNGHGEAIVDLVSTVSSSAASGSAASAAAVLSFFVLLGSAVVRGNSGAAG